MKDERVGRVRMIPDLEYTVFTATGDTERRHSLDVGLGQSISLILDRMCWHCFGSHMLSEY